MTKLVEFIKRQSFLSFITLNFAITWAFWLLLPAEAPGEIPVQFLIGSFGPAIAAVIVSAVLRPAQTAADQSKRWATFGLMLAAGALVIWLSRDYLFAGDYSIGWLVPAGLAVLTAACLLSLRYSGVQGIRQLLAPIFDWKKSAKWYAFVLLFVPATYALSVLSFEPLTGRLLPAMPYRGTLGQLPLAILAAFSLRLFFGGANEELGWRGFAIPQLQQRYSPLMASVIIGLLWGLWHLPLHLNGVYSTGWLGLAQVAARMVFSIPFAIVLTWVFNRSGGNLLLVMLFHAANNTTAQFLLPGFIEQFMLWILAIVLLVEGRMWRHEAAVEETPGLEAAAA